MIGSSNGSGPIMMDATSDWEKKGGRLLSVHTHSTRNGHANGGSPEDEAPLMSHRRGDNDRLSVHSDFSCSAGLRAQPEVTQRASSRMCFGVSLPGTGHTEYVFQISGGSGKMWKVSRRYSDFLDLDTKLRQMFGKPTRPFPPLPRKVLIGNQSEDVVNERQRMLAAYLQAVLDNSILSSTAEVQRFVDMEADVPPPVPSVFRSNLPRPLP
mmetsp:Transcript_31336/g.76809  ORF Transcript_31336/g.76809 Transcript_31336/m.76809 type:complete len:211 (+) Transcript_31336:42-674(+)